MSDNVRTVPMPTDDLPLHQLLRDLRDGRGLTQPALEELTRQLPGRVYEGDRRVAQGTIAMIETNKRGASRETLDNLADALHLTQQERDALYLAARNRKDNLTRARLQTSSGVVVELSGDDPAAVGRAQALALVDEEFAALAGQLDPEEMEDVKADLRARIAAKRQQR